jgi:hypothetical protein
MPDAQVGDREVVIAAILRAVGKRRPIRPHRTSDPAHVSVVAACPRLLGEAYAAPDQMLGLASGESASGESADRGLIGRRRRHLGTGAEIGQMSRNNRFRIVI